ncbi:MAG: hypothetical protein M3347_10895, partial [Armatimonadota bacterium]|nr:hypothetical protein [Armatimonadota bacterium]
PAPTTGSILTQTALNRHRASAAAEVVGFDVHALQHGHKQVGKRRVVFSLESAMLACLKPDSQVAMKVAKVQRELREPNHQAVGE